MNNELAIVEEFQSSQWGQISVREALSIAEDVLNEEKYVYVFKKSTNVGKDGNKKTYTEGWKVIEAAPNYYHSIGSMDRELEVGYFLKTLFSKQGEKKIPYDLPTNYWSLWFRFQQMFASAGITVLDGEVDVTDEVHMQELIDEWKAILATADGRPMITVLAEYTKEELDTIASWDDNQMGLELAELNSLVDCTTGLKFKGTETLLVKSMTGKVKSCKSRLAMRRGFWELWRDQRGDMLELAKTYSVITDKWSASKD